MSQNEKTINLKSSLEIQTRLIALMFLIFDFERKA